MKKWEYQIASCVGGFMESRQEKINDLGRDGWEAVAMYDDSVLLKREIPEPSPVANVPTEQVGEVTAGGSNKRCDDCGAQMVRRENYGPLVCPDCGKSKN